MNIEDLYRLSRRTAYWGILANVGLAVVKLLGGYFGGSVGLLSDAAHSFGDAVVSATVLAALVWAQRPPDREHPYGHTRAEAVAGSSVAVMLVLTAIWVGREAILTLGSPYHEPELYTLWIAAGNTLLKEVLYQYNRRVARRTGSTAVLATAWDHRFDAFATIAVLVGLVLARWGGPLGQAGDPVAGLIVAVLMLVSGAQLFWGSLQELMDRQADPELLSDVRREARAVPGVLGVEKVLVRKTGLEYLVDIHIEVDPELTVREGHAIAHAVKDRLVRNLLLIKDVLVHIEPAPNAPEGTADPKSPERHVAAE